MADPLPITPDSNGRWTAGVVAMGPEILDRMERAVLKVRERLLRATSALNQAGIAYAVVGGNAVASWVATRDEGAVRTTRDVDLLIQRNDLPAVTKVLENAGFVAGNLLDVVMFRDGHHGKPREALHICFAREKPRPHHLLPNPQIETVDDKDNCKVLRLELLVEMLVSQFRTEDKMLARDLMDVGLVDATWPARFPKELAERLQHLLDTPDG